MRKELRKLQRVELVNSSKRSSLRLESLFKCDKSAFWSKIAAFRRISKKRANISNKQPTARDFITFYSQLFSHHDRASNARHEEIERLVAEHYHNLKFDSFTLDCSRKRICEWIERLENKKAAGNDGLCNELLKYALCPSLCNIIKYFFDNIFLLGYIPENFNCAIIKPIPKKGEVREPSDYRPISISSVLSSLFEYLILEKIPAIKNSSGNQFGYKENSSCKNVFYVVNEAINFYHHGKSPLYIISLDAVKAFDKLWRAGLFFRLKEYIDPGSWRILYAYYQSSTAIVSVDGIRSSVFKTTQGVKQGGILSPFLFNFFLDFLIKENNSLNIGALLGTVNVSSLAYCDDLALLSPSKGQMEALLENCHRFACDWKLAFNPKKSVCYTSNISCHVKPKFFLGNLEIPSVEGFVYLGLPVGNRNYVLEYFNEKMKKVEKSFFSLRGLGWKPASLHPKSIAFLFKQFCQSIAKFGLENIYLSSTDLKSLNTRQSMLVKIGIGIRTYCKTKSLFNALKIEPFDQLYLKHKFFFLRQIGLNKFVNNIYDFLSSYYKNSQFPKGCFMSQLNQVKELTKSNPFFFNIKAQLKSIDQSFKCSEFEKVNEVCAILHEYDNSRHYVYTEQLNRTLRVEFYPV